MSLFQLQNFKFLFEYSLKIQFKTNCSCFWYTQEIEYPTSNNANIFNELYFFPFRNNYYLQLLMNFDISKLEFSKHMIFFFNFRTAGCAQRNTNCRNRKSFSKIIMGAPFQRKQSNYPIYFAYQRKWWDINIYVFPFLFLVSYSFHNFFQLSNLISF